MLGARIWTFLKFSRFSSKTAIFKRLEKGRGLAMTESKNWDEQMKKFSTKSDALKSARTRSLWGKNWAKSDSKKAVKNLKLSFSFDHLVPYKAGLVSENQFAKFRVVFTGFKQQIGPRDRKKFKIRKNSNSERCFCYFNFIRNISKI